MAKNNAVDIKNKPEDSFLYLFLGTINFNSLRQEAMEGVGIKKNKYLKKQPVNRQGFRVMT